MEKRTHNWWLFLGGATAVVFAIWLYWPTLSLPLIYDSLLHIRITNSLNWLDVWLPTEAFGFYRPMTFVPLLLVNNLFGHYPAWLLHGSNVAQHALNVGLIIWLTQRVAKKWQLSVAVGFLFAAFPFSYQAVAVYGHNVHPAITNVLLLGLHTYLSGLESKRPFYWLATTFFFLLALLTHESAVLFGPMAALMQWTQPQFRPKSWRDLFSVRRSPWLVFLGLGIVYLGVYQLLPISRAPQAGVPSATSLGLRGLYLGQAAVYPLAWLGNWAGVETAVSIIVLSLVLLLIMLGWRIRQPTARLPLLLGVGWWGMAYVLIGLPLSTDYLLRGPRLLYLGSVGVCLMWGWLFWGNARGRIGQVVGLILTTAVLLINTHFIRQQLLVYQQITEPVSLAREVLTSEPEETAVLFFNLPQWINPLPNTYPVGVEFVSMLGGYLFVEELVHFNLQRPYPAQATVLNEQFNETSYTVGLHDQTAFDAIDWEPPTALHLFLTQYNEQGPHTVYQGVIQANGTSFVPTATFVPFSLGQSTAVYCNDALTVQMQWQYNPKETVPSHTMLVQALAESGQLVGQADGPPLGVRADLLNTTRPYTDIRRMNNLPEPPHTVLIGVYDFLSGQRLNGLDSEQRPLADHVLRIPVQQCKDEMKE